MFDYFNKPALDDAINAGKEIRFSHNPEAYGECALKSLWSGECLWLRQTFSGVAD